LTLYIYIYIYKCVCEVTEVVKSEKTR